MKEENLGSDNSGSPIANNVPNANSFDDASGETFKESSNTDPNQLKELETLVGRQGEELGEYRKFFSEIAPLLDKLDESPEIVQAIIDGNITQELARAAIEGKINLDDAKIVTKAEVEVKKELGKEGMKATSTEDISKLIEEKAQELKKDFEKELKERDELASFESRTNTFIANTSDFSKYASEIDKWLDEHDNVTDISVAYYAVKGELSEKEAIKQAELEKIEAEKNGALNMGGGSSVATRIKGDNNILDKLVSGKSNPNIF